MVDEDVNFILLYQGRTGSSYLMSALDQHPDITAHGEILNWLSKLIVPSEQLSGPRRLFEIVVRFVKREPGRRQLRAVRQLYDPPARASRVIGFKTKARRVGDLPGLQKVLEEQKVRTIVMERRNFVKKAVAHVYGKRLFEKTRHVHGERAWNLFDESDRLGPQYISPAELDKNLKKVIRLDEQLQGFANALDVPKLRLEYSDLLRDKDEWFRTIFEFLDVEPRALESPVLRNEPVDLRDAVTNFDELRTCYRGTAFEPMFDEDAP